MVWMGRPEDQGWDGARQTEGLDRELIHSWGGSNIRTQWMLSQVAFLGALVILGFPRVARAMAGQVGVQEEKLGCT